MRDKVLNILNLLLSFGGLWKDGKTITGIVSYLLSLLAMLLPEGFVLQHLSPELVESIRALLAHIGFGLVATGVSHKVVKLKLK